MHIPLKLKLNWQGCSNPSQVELGNVSQVGLGSPASAAIDGENGFGFQPASLPHHDRLRQIGICSSFLLRDNPS